MEYAVTLCLDADAAARVSALWQRLADAGLADDMVRLGYPPHVTLAVYPALGLDAARMKLAALTNGLGPVPIVFAGFGAFAAERNVLFLAPAADPWLAEFQARLVQVLATPPHRHFRPGAWVPHCSLSTALPFDRLGEALQTVAPGWLAFEAQADRIQIVSHPPVKVLWERRLAAPDRYGASGSVPSLSGAK